MSNNAFFSKCKKMFTSFIPSSKNEIDSTIATIKKSKIFQGLNQKEYNHLASLVEHLRLDSNTVIYSENDVGDSCYIITEGAIVATVKDGEGNEVVVARLEKFDFFGEQSLLSQDTNLRSITAKTAENTTLIKIKREDFINIIDNNNDCYQKLTLKGKKQSLNKLSKLLKFIENVDNKTLLSLSNNFISFKQGDIIYNIDDETNGAYFILSGTVIVRKNNIDGNLIETKLSHGKLLGEIEILKQSKRNATAIAETDVKILFLSNRLFQKIYNDNPLLQSHLRHLHQIYEIENRGVVSIFRGKTDNDDASTFIYTLDDGTSFLATKIIDSDIFKLNKLNSSNTRVLSYQHDNIYREIIFENDIPVGVSSNCFWRDLSTICDLIFTQSELSTWEQSLFKDSGHISIKTTNNNNDTNKPICNCMQVSSDTIMTAINSGCKDVKAISNATSAATICGGCRMRIEKLLGHNNWHPVYIDKVISHNDLIRSYQLKPFNETLDSFFVGQHLVIQAFINNNLIERTYTVTSLPEDLSYYEITVQKENNGYFSTWLFENENNTPFLRVSPPSGKSISEIDLKQPLICLIGGIGITPVIALLRHLHQQSISPTLHIDYSISSQDRLSFNNELTQYQQNDININIRITSEQSYINQRDIEQLIAQYGELNFYICGSEKYSTGIDKILNAMNIPSSRIFKEVFIHPFN